MLLNSWCGNDMCVCVRARAQVEVLRQQIEVVNQAATEIRSSRKLAKVLPPIPYSTYERSAVM